MTMHRLKRGDYVTILNFPYVLGKVKRVAKDGSWADVYWLQLNTGAGWSKRQYDVTLLRMVVE